ncbi:hypothetical protein ND747_00930 [Frankia sp. R82]|nr:hypothetical protein [Frankia sp. R82]
MCTVLLRTLGTAAVVDGKCATATRIAEEAPPVMPIPAQHCACGDW